MTSTVEPGLGYKTWVFRNKSVSLEDQQPAGAKPERPIVRDGAGCCDGGSSAAWHDLQRLIDC